MRYAALLLLFAIVGALGAGSGDVRAEGGHFGAGASLSLTTTVPGAARGLSLTLSIPNGDFPRSSAIVFEPSAATFTLNCNKPGYRDLDNDNVVDGGETPCLAASAAAGSQSSGIARGVLNGACNSSTAFITDFFAVGMPNNELDPRASTNIAFPRPDGTTDRFGGWSLGVEPPPLGGTATADINGDNRADATTISVTSYPSYLLDYFDPDGAGAALPVLPRAVYGGLTTVSNDWYPVYYAQFAAGVLATAFSGQAPHPFSRAVTDAGQPGVIVVGDPTSARQGPSSTSDICAPMNATITLPATVGGVTRATNPGTSATHLTMVWQTSGRDLDNDGYETSLDSCPLAANTENPRVTAGPDGDMLDSVCDPTPAVGDNDADADAFLNGLDDCPLVANATQMDSEVTKPADYVTHSPDGGPPGDQIGDECDTGSVGITLNGKSHTITLSSTVGNGHWHISGRVIARCYGNPPVDVDGDGYCAAQDTGADSGVCAAPPAAPAGPLPTCNVRHDAWTTTAFYSAILATFDTDGGGGDTTSPADPDLIPENGFDSDWFETNAGTDATMPCSQDTTVLNEPLDSWLWDVNDDTRANISDIVAMGDSFGTFINDTTLPNLGDPRTDFNSDGATNLSDVVALGPVFNKQCRPQDLPQ